MNRLWLDRLKLVLVSPLLILLALGSALNEAWFEFYLDIKDSWRDVARIWRGE